VLVAPVAFNRKLSAVKVGAAIAHGLELGGLPVDRCPVELDREEAISALLDGLSFDARMRSARAVVTGEQKLDRQSLARRPLSEIATRARQAGVPSFAVVGSMKLDSFGLRILDLQVVLEANNERALKRAGRELADLIRP
jgi:glycerate kinase